MNQKKAAIPKRGSPLSCVKRGSCNSGGHVPARSIRASAGACSAVHTCMLCGESVGGYAANSKYIVVWPCSAVITSWDSGSMFNRSILRHSVQSVLADFDVYSGKGSVHYGADRGCRQRQFPLLKADRHGSGLVVQASDRGEFPVRRGDARGETERLRNSGPAVFHEFGAVQFCGAARVCIIRAKRAGSWAGLGELPVSGTGREGIPDRENTKGIVAKDSVIHPVRRASPGRRPCRWWTDARRRR